MADKVVEELKDEFKDHLQEHEKNYNLTLSRHDMALFGPDGTGGLNKTILSIQGKFDVIDQKINAVDRKLTSTNKTMKDVGVGLILAIVATAFAVVFGA